MQSRHRVWQDNSAPLPGILCSRRLMLKIYSRSNAGYTCHVTASAFCTCACITIHHCKYDICLTQATVAVTICFIIRLHGCRGALCAPSQTVSCCLQSYHHLCQPWESLHRQSRSCNSLARHHWGAICQADRKRKKKKQSA